MQPEVRVIRSSAGSKSRHRSHSPLSPPLSRIASTLLVFFPDTYSPPRSWLRSSAVFIYPHLGCQIFPSFASSSLPPSYLDAISSALLTIFITVPFSFTKWNVALYLSRSTIFPPPLDLSLDRERRYKNFHRFSH